MKEVDWWPYSHEIISTAAVFQSLKQVGQLLVTGENMYTRSVGPDSVRRLTDRSQHDLNIVEWALKLQIKRTKTFTYFTSRTCVAD